MSNLKELIIRFFKSLSSNSHWVLVFLGVSFLLISEPVGKWLNNICNSAIFIGQIDYSSVFHTIGTSVLVSGVFAFLMKSTLFSRYYKNLFFEVIYDPNKRVGEESIKDKWKILSNSLLISKVPFEPQEVSDKLMKDFLEREIDYGFKNIEIVFKISKIKDSVNKVKVVQVFRADVIFDREFRELEIKQRFMCDKEKFSCSSILIDNKPISDNDFNFDNDRGLVNLNYKVGDPRDYCHDSSKFGSFRFDRTSERQQDIRDDPVIVGSYSRYIRRMSILIKTEGVDYVLYKTGTGSCRHSERVQDGSKYWHHIIADSSSLLLPGEGYTLTIIPIQQEEINETAS